MDFKIKFNMDNAMFDEQPESEIARILKSISSQVKNGITYGKIVDLNGNSVGSWGFEY